MELVIAVLALIAVISWAFSANWNRHEQMSSQEVLEEGGAGGVEPKGTVEEPSHTVQEVNIGPSETNSWQLNQKENFAPEAAGVLNGDDYEYWKREGDRLLISGCYKEAIAAYEGAIKYRPNATQAWQQRGEGLKRLKLYDEAIASYNKAIEVSSNPISRYQAWNGLGALLFNLQRYEESIDAYHQALAICPNGMGSLQLLQMEGIAWSKLRRYEEASACYDKSYDNAVELSEKMQGKLRSVAQHGFCNARRRA